MTASELMAVATDPAAFDKIIKEIVQKRESAHDRERRAQAAEAKLEASEKVLAAATEALDRDIAQARKSLSEREAVVAAKEVEIEQREARIARFNQMIATA